MSHRCIINVTYTDLLSWEKLLYCWRMGIVPLTAFGFSQYWEWEHKAPLSHWFFYHRIMPQIHQSFLDSFKLLMEAHHLITEEVLLVINSWTICDWFGLPSVYWFFFSDLLFLLSSHLPCSLKQASSACSSAWCPAMTTAWPHGSPAPAVLSASPHLNLAQHPPWPSPIQRKSQAYWYQLDISQLICVTQFKALICIPFHSTATGWVLTSRSGEVNGYFHKE